MATPVFSTQSHWQFSHFDSPLPFDLFDEEPGTFGLSFPPTLVRHLIHTYSRPQDTVLDPFLGQGTTVYEALMMGRRAIGVDCNEQFLDRVRSGLLIPFGSSAPDLHVGDARSLEMIEDESVDLIVTQPPYGNTISFSRHLADDLSRLHGRDFLVAIEQTASELLRVLKPGGRCILLVGDIKDRGRMMPLGFQFTHRFLSRGFSIKAMNPQLPAPLHKNEYLMVFEKKQKASKHA